MESKRIMIVNLKNYQEVAGPLAKEIALRCEQISDASGFDIAVAPPTHMLSEMSRLSIKIFAQHTDDAQFGATTGFTVPESLKMSGVSGVILNHSEHRMPEDFVKKMIPRLKATNLISVVCVADERECRRYARLNPDYIAIEPPELIGSGRAVSVENPKVIRECAKMIRHVESSSRLLCGAGITAAKDVKEALEIGVDGIIVSSAVAKAKDPESVIENLSKQLWGF